MLKPAAAITLCVALTACAACAASAPRALPLTDPAERVALLLSSAPPPNEDCVVRREQLPAADELVDSAAVVAQLREVDAGHVILSVGFDTAGAVTRTNVAGHAGDSATIAAIGRTAIRPAGGPAAWRLRLDAGPSPRLRVGLSEMCMPVMLNREVIAAALRGIDPDPATSVRGVRPEVFVDYRVGVDGRVMEMKMEKPSNNRELDERVLGLAGAFRFRPAYIDGVPVPVWVRVPVTLRFDSDR